MTLPVRPRRQLVPWLVKERDLRRYLGRAVDFCGIARVLFFYHTHKHERRLLALVPIKDSQQRIAEATLDFTQGRYLEVVLENLRSPRC